MRSRAVDYITIGMLIGMFLSGVGAVWVWPIVDYYMNMHSADGILEKEKAPPIQDLSDGNAN